MNQETMGLVLMIAAFVIFESLAWRARAREQRGWLRQWAAYDAASERRHREFIAELREARGKK